MTDYSELSPMQKMCLEIPLRHNVALLGGRGGGKSTAAMLLALAHVAEYPNDASILIVRKTFRALTDFEGEMLQLVNVTVGSDYKYNRSEKILRIGPARIELAAFEDAKSFDKLVGKNFSMLIVEEVTQHASERRLRLLRSTLRAPKGVITRVIYVGNPGGPLHTRIYERHILGKKPAVPYSLSLGEDTDDTESWVTVPSVASDNPFISVLEYERRLREATYGDPIKLQQWLYGQWELGSGRMFENWNEEVHVLPTPDNFMVNTDQWRPVVAIDWGLTSPSVGFLGIVAKRPLAFHPGVLAPRGSLYILSEITDAIMDNPEDLSKSYEWTPARLGEKIVNRCRALGVNNPSGVVDSARGLRGENLHEEMRVEGFWSLTPPKKGRRSEGYATIASMLQAAVDKDPNRPHLYISPKCHYLLSTLPLAVRDENDPDDIADTPACPDHGIDAARYLVSEARQLRTIGSGRHTGMS
jgi:hypothetical protein